MSSDERLERLGLSHLRDKPEELKAALEAILKRHDKKVERWREERQRRTAKR